MTIGREDRIRWQGQGKESCLSVWGLGPEGIELHLFQNHPKKAATPTSQQVTMTSFPLGGRLNWVPDSAGKAMKWGLGHLHLEGLSRGLSQGLELAFCSWDLLPV